MKKTLGARTPSRRTVVAAGCLVYLSLGAPALGAADAVASASVASPNAQGFVHREFDRFRAHARFDRAFRLLEANQLADAAREFSDGLALDPDHVDARLGYAQLLAKRGAYAASVVELDGVLKRADALLSALQLRAQMHVAAGDLRAAIADQHAVARHSAATAAERRFALESAADLYLRIGQYDQALGALDRLPAGRSDTQTLVRRALVYEKMQRYNDAEEAYRTAASRTDDPARRAQWAEAARVAATLAAHRHVQAVSVALNLSLIHVTSSQPTSSPASNPVKSDPALMLAAIQPPARVAKQPAATAQPRLLARRDPLPQDRLRLAHLAARGGRTKEAIGLLNELSASTLPRATRIAALRQLAALHTERGSHAQARSAYERLVELDPDDPAGLASLARAHLELGEHAAAVQAAQRSLALRESVASIRLLAFAQAQAGGWSAAANTYEMLLAHPVLRAQERLEALGQLAYALDQLKRYRESAEALERALAVPGGNTMALHERLAHARWQAGDMEGVAAAHRRALDVKTATEDERHSVWSRLGAVQQTLGRTDEAIATYRSLLAHYPDDTQARLALGTLLRSQGSWQEAEPHLVVALEHRTEATAALELARGLKANSRASEATDVLLRAADADVDAAPKLRKQIVDELGYLHESTADLKRAAAAWADSLKIENDPRIALALASVQLRAGQREAARGTLDELAAMELPDATQVARLDMVWQLESADGHHALARDAAEQVLALQPSALRRYHAALSERELGHLPQAIAHLERVVAEDPQTEYLDALAYTYRAAGSYTEAARTFETLLQRDPERSALYADLAYTYMRVSDNDRALEWFKRAIDKRRERISTIRLAQAPGGAPMPAVEPPREDEDIRAMRDEVRKLSETWSLNAYQSVRTSRGDRPSTVSGNDSSGLIPSQGGVEFSWRPPVIGLRDERTLDVFARMLWSNEPRSLKIQSASRQAGIGVRFKPLREHSLYFTVERLIKIGDNAQDDWLMRASYGWVDGYQMRVDQNAWNYTSLFADVGVFTDRAHTRAIYLEARQGRSFRISDRWILTPHLVANTRRQSPDPGRVNYSEAGAGVSARYLFNESEYATPRSSVEFLLQYKKGFAAAKSGWQLATIVRY
ncbi:tetratricopeptide repeat protein [Variovorax paradoxus]|nr:tetratricopeptide repeat protein [Variovorax paradoxus]